MNTKKYVFYSKIEMKDNEGMFEGYITTKDKDLVNDIVTSNCMVSMMDQLNDRSIKLDLEHASFRGSTELEKELNKTLIPIGKIEEASIDKKGIKVKAKLNPHHSRYEEVKNSMKDGFLDAFSIAFIPKKQEHKTEDQNQVRYLDDITLLNVALTGNPVNTEAKFTDVILKSLNDLKEKEVELMTTQETKKEVKEEEEDEVSKPEEKEKVEVKSETIDFKALNEKLDNIQVSLNELKSIKEKIEEHEKVLSKPQFKAKIDPVVEKKEVKEEIKSRGIIERL